MTAPTEPLISLQSLRDWTQQEISDEDPFAANILMGVSIKLWEYGSSTWTAETLPPSARLMGELKAKNYFEHPTGASREQVDVISESFINEVLVGLTFTEEEQKALGEYALDTDPDAPVSIGVWALTVSRGPLETHQNAPRGTEWAPDSWASGFPLLPGDYFLGSR